MCYLRGQPDLGMRCQNNLPQAAFAGCDWPGLERGLSVLSVQALRGPELKPRQRQPQWESADTSLGDAE